MNPQSSRKLSSLNPDSAAWLTACLDPYHDNQLELEGLPDERSAPSVVQMHNQTITLTAPATAGGGNWDASVLYTGFDSVLFENRSKGGLIASGGLLHIYDSTNIGVGQPFGALCAWTGAAGASWPTGSLNSAETPVGAALGSCSPYEKCRLIAVGYEIHNTTAEVYKQGSLIVAQLPDAACDHGTVAYCDVRAQDPWLKVDAQSDRGCLRASTSTPLQAIPGSQTWPAADGVYVIPRMTQVPRAVNELVEPAAAAGFMGRGPVIRGTDGLSATIQPCNYTGGAPNTLPIWKSYFPSGFSPVQTFLTGLSNQTTLTVTFRTVVEYFPDMDSGLLPLASPSPAYDAKAFALYGGIVARAPYAVPVGQNSAGEYFRKIMAIASKSLGLLAPMFGEYAPLATVAGRMGEKYFTQKKGDKINKREAGARAVPTRK